MGKYVQALSKLLQNRGFLVFNSLLLSLPWKIHHHVTVIIAIAILEVVSISVFGGSLYDHPPPLLITEVERFATGLLAGPDLASLNDWASGLSKDIV